MSVTKEKIYLAIRSIFEQDNSEMPMTRQRAAALRSSREVVEKPKSPPPKRRRVAAKSSAILPVETPTLPATPPYQSAMKIDEMPDKCLLAIIRFIDPAQLVTLERVSSRWCRLAQESWKHRSSIEFWRVLERTWRRYGDLNFEPQCFVRDTLWRCGGQLRELSFAECPPFRISRFTLEMIGQDCPNLASLDLTGRLLADSAVQGLLAMPNLRRLSLSKCFESGNMAYEARKNIDKALAEVLPKLWHLTVLNMEGNRGIGTQGAKQWFIGLKLTTLNVIGTGLTPLSFQSFVNDHAGVLREFRASEFTFTCGSYWYSLNSSGRDVQMSSLAKSMLQTWQRDLRTLELREFTLCFEEEFKPAIRLLPNLINLTELRVPNNKLINDELLASICSHCTKLQTVSVASCPLTLKGLQSLATLDDLRNIDVSKLKCVTDGLFLSLAVRMALETVNMRDCGARVTKDSIYYLLLNCPAISLIDVRGCKRMTPEAIAEFIKCQHVKILSTGMPFIGSAHSHS